MDTPEGFGRVSRYVACHPTFVEWRRGAVVIIEERDPRIETEHLKNRIRGDENDKGK